MSKSQEYQLILRNLEEWEPFLLNESGLPGPRGNIELAQAVAEEGNLSLFQHLVTFTVDKAPTNSPYEFLAFCGVIGLGRILAEGKESILLDIRHFANDPRWRMREGVAMALQRFGEVNMDRLIIEMKAWSQGTALERRAAVAALCEPKLLRQPRHVIEVMDILDRVTTSIEQSNDRKDENFLTLRKGLGYCWSVAVAALPIEGKARMEKWLVQQDKDVYWIMRENLKKQRLIRMDDNWVKEWQERLSH
jgi:hypothetical protein